MRYFLMLVGIFALPVGMAVLSEGHLGGGAIAICGIAFMVCGGICEAIAVNSERERKLLAEIKIESELREKKLIEIGERANQLLEWIGDIEAKALKSSVVEPKI